MSHPTITIASQRDSCILCGNPKPVGGIVCHFCYCGAVEAGEWPCGQMTDDNDKIEPWLTDLIEKAINP